MCSEHEDSTCCKQHCKPSNMHARLPEQVLCLFFCKHLWYRNRQHRQVQHKFSCSHSQIHSTHQLRRTFSRKLRHRAQTNTCHTWLCRWWVLFQAQSNNNKPQPRPRQQKYVASIQLIILSNWSSSDSAATPHMTLLVCFRACGRHAFLVKDHPLPVHLLPALGLARLSMNIACP